MRSTFSICGIQEPINQKAVLIDPLQEEIINMKLESLKEHPELIESVRNTIETLYKCEVLSECDYTSILTKLSDMVSK